MPRPSKNLHILAPAHGWEHFYRGVDRNKDEAMISPQSTCSSVSTTNESSPIYSSFGDTSRHSRAPSSNSSLSSSPNPGDSADATFTSTKKTLLDRLPEVEEDPMERETEHDRSRSLQWPQPSWNDGRWSYGTPRMRPSSFFRSDRIVQDGFPSEYEGQWAKRRRSGEEVWNSFATGVSSRFSSMSRRTREKKRASRTFFESRYESSASSSSSPTFHSRSSSFQRSFGRQSLEHELDREEAQQAHANIETIMEDVYREPSTDKLVFPADEAVLPLPSYEEQRSTTPILAPLMVDGNPKPATLMQSPLQSPTVAVDSGTHSLSHTPDGTPQLSGVTSPALSSRPSMASINRSRASTIVPSTEIPQLVMVDPNDEWAEKLGHANFEITPEPYVPEVSDKESCDMLMKDWEMARSEYAKHLARTEMHFGSSSRTLKLTEEKWASIDAQWKRNNEIASRRGVMTGRFRHPSPKQPAPVAKLPQLDDPRLVQGEDIPGPMTIDEPMSQATPQLRRKASKRALFLKMFGNFQFPSTSLGRSAATTAITH